MFRFAATQWLFALILLPVVGGLFWMAALQRRAALQRFGDLELVRKLTQSVSPAARRVKGALLAMVVGLSVLALARPQFGTRVETVQSVGQDVVVAVDLSRSMLAEDLTPNRLERARLAILRLMGKLDGDRIGLVAFAADAFVQSPLTVDYAAAGMFLSAMHPDLMPVQGTDLGAAIRVGLDALEEGARETSVLVVVTDGEDHEEDLDAQVQRAAGAGVKIHMVGIGSAEGVPIPEYDQSGRRQGFLRDADGNVVTTRLGEETLRSVASATGGRFVRAGVGGTALDDLFDEIARAEGEAIDELQITLFEEQYQIFLGLALVLLLAEWMVADRRRRQPIREGRFA